MAKMKCLIRGAAEGGTDSELINCNNNSVINCTNNSVINCTNNSVIFQRIILVLMLGIFMANLVTAFAVTKSHSAEMPLRVMPGEEGEAWIELQNHVGGEDARAEIRVLRGKEMISNMKDVEGEFEIRYGEEARIPIIIEMPSRARVGENYGIKLSVLIKGNERGVLTFNSEIIQTIPVVAGEPPQVVENVPVLYGDSGNSEAEKPSKRSYEKFIVLIVVLAGILIVVKVIIAMNRGKEK